MKSTPKFLHVFLAFAFLLMLLPACYSPSLMKPSNQKLTPLTNALVGLLQTSDAPIVIAPIVTVETSFSAEEFDKAGGHIDQWKKNAADQLSQSTHRTLHDALDGYKNFKLIDRASVEKIFSDLKISKAISSDERLMLGKMLGATHLVLAHVSRSPADGTKSEDMNVKDTYTNRLMDVATGEILATDTAFQ
jgi:curli biogenesis system outer membrane secretion channel CsgG